MFMAKNVNLVDSLLIVFCEHLPHLSSNMDPIYQAKQDLRYYIEDAFDHQPEDQAL